MDPLEPPIIERTPEEKRAYLQGYRAGVLMGAKHGEPVALHLVTVIERALDSEAGDE